MTVSKKPSDTELDLEGIQEVSWNKRGAEPSEEHTYFYGNGNENYELGTSTFVHKRIVAAVKSVRYASGRCLT
jgi:hypothetical protein